VRKYYIYSVIIAFFFGLMVAGVGTGIFIRGHVETTVQDMDHSFLAAWAQHATEAYEHESPEVGVWRSNRKTRHAGSSIFR